MTPPRTWADVCVTGAKLTKGNVVGYAIPIGTTGGIGGAQAFGELHLSTLLSAPDGKYFADDNRTIAFSKESFVRGAQVIKDQFLKCKSTPMASLQYGFNEVHDGLRSGTIAMATFGLYRYRTIQAQGAGDDLAWAPPPGFTPDERAGRVRVPTHDQRSFQAEGSGLAIREIHDQSCRSGDCCAGR